MRRVKTRFKALQKWSNMAKTRVVQKCKWKVEVINRKSAWYMILALIVCISYDKLCRLVIFTCGVMDSNILCWKNSGVKTLGSKDGENVPHHHETPWATGALSGPVVGRHTCCISWRGSDGHARGARGLPLPPLLRCGIRSWCSCGAWPPAASCLAAAWSRRARCSESPRRSELRGTPPEEGGGGGGDGTVSPQFGVWHSLERYRRSWIALAALAQHQSNNTVISASLTPDVNYVYLTSPHLGLLLLSGVHNGGAADLGQFAALTVERPAANLVPDHIFDEEDAAVEAERQPVEQLDVLQQVVVRVTEGSRETKKCLVVYLALQPPAHSVNTDTLAILEKKQINHVCNGGSGGGQWGRVSYLV